MSSPSVKGAEKGQTVESHALVAGDAEGVILVEDSENDVEGAFDARASVVLLSNSPRQPGILSYPHDLQVGSWSPFSEGVVVGAFDPVLAGDGESTEISCKSIDFGFIVFYLCSYFPFCWNPQQTNL